jgi:TonB family protein
VARSIAKVLVLLAALAACGGGNGAPAAAPAPSVVVLDAPPAAPVASTSPPSAQVLDETDPAAAATGPDALTRLAESRSASSVPAGQHRTFVGRGFERWRSAIEGYVSSVTPGSQLPLTPVATTLATYLNGMHNRIHPIFADSFLGSLDGLPPNHPMNDQHLVTRLEIILTKDGHLKKMGIVRTSGITAFDIAALDAVDRAQPFGPVPGAIISPDGNTYLHWEFHRDEVYACSTMGARPFILNQPAKSPDPTQPPALPSGPPSPLQERTLPPTSPGDAREGLLEPALPAVARSGS